MSFLLVGWDGTIPLVCWMVAEQSQAWEHVPGEPDGRNYYLEKDVKCWKPALCHETSFLGSFYWVKPVTFWNLSVRVTSIILTPFHRNFRVNILKSEEGIITVESSRLKASRDEVGIETDRAGSIPTWKDLHKQRYQARRLNTTEKTVSQYAVW